MQHRNWKSILQQASASPEQLLSELDIEDSSLISRQANQDFPLRVPAGFISKMSKNDPADPLFKQIWPSAEEEIDQTGFSKDPLNEVKRQAAPGLLHKYHGRVLLVLTGACAIHCRYCFRRHFPYSDSNPSGENLQKAIEYLQKETSVTEVILSGGDPLSLSDERLSELVSRLAEIPHLKRLRIHTRFPVVVPERINEACLDWLSRTHLQLAIVLHVNHANELDKSVEQAILKLRNRNISLFNQSVLLKGINDSVQALVALSEALFSYGIIPYYLHMLDPVSGTSHFEVDESSARLLMQEIQKRLPGYLVPRLVREDPETAHKTIINF
ncbi:MAG: EF-P beta-lysylation protein EpmB [Gammaproteobacteria bacterium]|nr:MAG: EF-P beta-lysylation protein EpmB [Gammaproteobacteria bacterium]RKZ71192.1 MAG: EF-P beta-lysylation protein EpmB [Gammaproteobacteria bacterium]